ncbi:MAG TPA: hypothetical protein PLH94_08800 [Fimbriimonadaceae bacterium]|nr:hypothetical protein [Fimbriimonadaceae bacterium]
MDARQAELWDRIRRFEIDAGPVGLTFTRRLARENRWSVKYAEGVVAEYRRFVFLAMEAGHPVTPSDQVDQAWHLHLTYTQSYWSRLCGEVLPRPLHHNPTEGGRAEDEKFEDWYERTRASYARLFGAEPPADIWPSSEVRFAERYERLSTQRNWVIPKASLRRTATMVAGAIATIAFVGGCIGLAAPGASDSRLLWTVGLIALFVLAMVGIVTFLSRAAHSRQGMGGSGCGTFSSGCGNRHDDHDSAGDIDGGSGCGSGCGGGD